MSLYTDIVADIVKWTNRPDLTTEMDVAIRQALRAAHKAGTFYRDLVSLDIPGLDTSQPTQTIDLSISAPLYRQVAVVKPTGYEVEYKETHILNLFDQDKYYQTNVFYIVGNTLTIRPESPTSSITLIYYRNPTLSPIASIDSWIATQHQDLIVCWAAASVLAMMNEQEIKTRVEAIAAISLKQLISDSLYATAR